MDKLAALEKPRPKLLIRGIWLDKAKRCAETALGAREISGNGRFVDTKLGGNFGNASPFKIKGRNDKPLRFAQNFFDGASKLACEMFEIRAVARTGFVFFERGFFTENFEIKA